MNELSRLKELLISDHRFRNSQTITVGMLIELINELEQEDKIHDDHMDKEMENLGSDLY